MKKKQPSPDNMELIEKMTTPEKQAEPEEQTELEEQSEPEEQTESEEGPDDIMLLESMRKMQLQELFDTLEQEYSEAWFDEEPALEIWLTDGDEELTCYLRYHMIDADRSKFVLEAVVPMEVMENEEKAARLCMDYNKRNLESVAYFDEGRLFLRILYKEQGTPIDEGELYDFFYEIKRQWELFHVMLDVLE